MLILFILAEDLRIISFATLAAKIVSNNWGFFSFFLLVPVLACGGDDCKINLYVQQNGQVIITFISCLELN